MRIQEEYMLHVRENPHVNQELQDVQHMIKENVALTLPPDFVSQQEDTAHTRVFVMGESTGIVVLSLGMASECEVSAGPQYYWTVKVLTFYIEM